MVELATEYGRYGYRRVTALLREEGFRVNHKRVERLLTVLDEFTRECLAIQVARQINQ